MSAELYWMAATGVIVALMWAPYILGYIGNVGVVAALTVRKRDDVGDVPWVLRAKRAHMNAVENFVVFAPLCIAVVVADAASGATALAAMTYFWLRLGHWIVYTAGVPVVRTLLFAGGVVCQLVLAAALLF